MPDLKIIDPSSGEAVTSPPAWPTGKKHISFSEIQGWLDCPYRHKLLHIDKLGAWEESPYLSFGNAVHNACENYIKTGKMDKSVALKHIRSEWKKNDFSDDHPIGSRDECLKSARIILDDVPVFLDENFPGWEPLDAEEKLYESIADQEISLKGLIDAVIKVKDKRGKDVYWLLDWKTATWGWKREKKQDYNMQLQLILYKTYWAIKHDVPLKSIRCAFVLLKRTGGKRRCELVPVSVGPKTQAKALKTISDMIASVHRKMFLKNRYSCKFCEFFETPHCRPCL